MLRSLWRGEMSLAKAYWVYGVAGLCALNLVLGGLLAQVSREPPSALLALALLVIALAAAAYAGLVSVAISRSAGRYEGSLVWTALARLAVAGGAFFAVLTAAGELGW